MHYVAARASVGPSSKTPQSGTLIPHDAPASQEETPARQEETPASQEAIPASREDSGGGTQDAQCSALKFQHLNLDWVEKS